MRTNNTKALDAINIATASVTSSAIDTEFVFNASVIVKVTGSSPNGSVKVQASNDISSPLNGNAETNWVDIASQTVSFTDVGVYIIPKFDVCYQAIRLVYTKVSGTGALTANVKTNGA